MKDFKVAVIVSPDRSDLYFANQLIRRLNVVGVVVESQRYPQDDTPVIKKAMRLAKKPHVLFKRVMEKISEIFRGRFAVYNKTENITDFGQEGLDLYPQGDCKTLHTTGVNDINAQDNVDWLQHLMPDVIAVCGASIIKEDILNIPPKGVLNLHGGLSQKYRGLFTTDWAIFNEEPEYIGATVHYIAPGIDDGEVIYQGRPKLAPDDNPSTIYEKVVKLGINMMEQAVKDIERGSIRATKLEIKGDLYLRRMFTPAVESATWKKIRRGLITDYLDNKENRDKRVLSQIINDFNSPPAQVDNP